MGLNINIRELKKDINRFKKNLISKAKKNGLYENFGQTEVFKLKDKYDYFKREIGDLINDFEFNFCLKIDDNTLKSL